MLVENALNGGKNLCGGLGSITKLLPRAGKKYFALNWETIFKIN